MNETPAESRRLTISADTPRELWRADRAVQHLTQASRRQTNGLFDAQCVTLNGQPCAEPWRHLVEGDTIVVDFEPERRYKARAKPPKHLGFSIEYEDADVIVVDKPAAWLTVPASRADRDTLAQRLEQYVSRQNRGRFVRLSAAHRLDRGVSGLIVFGKHDEACQALRQQFAARTPDRRYVGIVAGRMPDDAGELRSYLTTDDRLNRASTDDPNSGELAVTRYAVIRRQGDTTLVRIELETGRRHQIRVHLAEAGHPLLGDPRYGRPASQHRRWTAPRIALHAEYLAFSHPRDGHTLEFEKPMPREFMDFLQGEEQRTDAEARDE